MQGAVTAWSGGQVKCGDDTGGVPDGATTSVVRRSCGPGWAMGSGAVAKGVRRRGRGGGGRVATKANGRRRGLRRCGGGFGVVVRAGEVWRGSENMCAAGGPQVGDGRRRGGRGEAAIAAKWRRWGVQGRKGVRVLLCTTWQRHDMEWTGKRPRQFTRRSKNMITWLTRDASESPLIVDFPRTFLSLTAPRSRSPLTLAHPRPLPAVTNLRNAFRRFVTVAQSRSRPPPPPLSSPRPLACPTAGQRLAGSHRALVLRGTFRRRRCYHRLPVH